MLFEKEKYYSYIGILEKMINFYYALFIGIFGIIGVATGNVFGLIIGVGLGFIMAKACTLGAKIKVQKMRWEMDIYLKLTEKK